MNKFKFKAKDSSGRMTTGEVEAGSEELAAKLVRKRGYVVLGLRPVRGGIFSFSRGLRSHVSSGDVTVFTRQLATMINAGLPIVEALTILRMQSQAGFQNVISSVLADVEGGESLSSSMGKHPKVFSKTYIALIKSGETGGVLDRVLTRLADNMERQQEFKGKVKGAMIYPAIVVIGMIAVSIIMMVFVIPRLLSLYSQFDAELPLPTKILLSISNIFLSYWYILIVAGGLLVWGFIIYSKTETGHRRIAELLFKIPIFGDLQKQIILTELTRTMSLMMGAGVPILDGLSVTSDVIGNILIVDALKDVQVQVEKGFPIAYSFAKHPDAFPYILSQMIAVGEETGKMEEVLSKLSHIFEVDSEQKVKALTAAIEPMVMILLGIGVTFLVIAVILPIYNLTQVLS